MSKRKNPGNMSDEQLRTMIAATGLMSPFYFSSTFMKELEERREQEEQLLYELENNAGLIFNLKQRMTIIIINYAFFVTMQSKACGMKCFDDYTEDNQIWDEYFYDIDDGYETRYD